MRCTRRTLLLAAAAAPVAAGCTSADGHPTGDPRARLARGYQAIGSPHTAELMRDRSHTELVAVPAPFLTRWQLWHWTYSNGSALTWGMVGLGPAEGQPDTVILLNDKPEGFNAVLANDGARIQSPEAARQAAEAFDETTRPFVGAHQRVESVDAISWIRSPGPEGQRRIAEIQNRYRGLIAPTSVADVGGGFVATYWVVLQQKLYRHRLTVRPDRVDDAVELVESGLPTGIGL